MSALTFKRLQVGPFAGISKDKPIILEFPKVSPKTKKRPIGKLTGDQGLGKTSFLHFLLKATKQNFNLKDKELVNLESGEMSGEIEFNKNGVNWKVVVTRTSFKLYRYFVADDEADWIEQGSIEKNLSTLIGNVAISPMKLKTDNGANQVDWLFKMLNVPADVVEKTQKLTAELNEIVTVRAKANKEYLFLKKSLQENPLFVNWEQSVKKYAEKKTIDSLKVKLGQATQNKARFSEAKERVKTIVTNISNKKSEIESLETKLDTAKKELAQQEAAKKIGDKWIEDNQKIETEYEAVHLEFVNLSTYLAEQGTWLQVQEDKRYMDEYETMVQRGDVNKTRLIKKKRELLKGVLPEVDGLEIVTEDEIEGLKTGIYLDGKNPNQLSESELFDLYFKLCRAQGVTMVLIENITSFGTDVVKTLNALAKSGVYVWATEMKRGQETLSIEFVDELT